ncbi:uncharacterized protein LOC135836466 isoform X1 [Planococcus citri]|uniref:uncharacterized protein LOC135836466 isoform X1 n=2 Tax=Planococcus citri TaxID=170843 RepID=UPI0031FA16B9
MSSVTTQTMHVGGVCKKMSILQVYEEILAEYNEMMQRIRRNEEISVNLAYEIQKELLRMSEISGQDDSLKDVYKSIQSKEEIMKKFSNENFDSLNIPVSEYHSLKETIQSASNLLEKVSAEFQELTSIDNESKDRE